MTILTLTCSLFVATNLVRLHSALNRMDSLKRPAIVGTQVLAANVFPCATKNLLLFLKPGCPSCEDSYDFYRRIIALADERSDRQVIGASTLPAELGTAYFEQAGLLVKHVLSSSQLLTMLQYTPTILLLDQHATIVKIWIGKLSPQEEAEVIKAFFES